MPSAAKTRCKWVILWTYFVSWCLRSRCFIDKGLIINHFTDLLVQKWAHDSSGNDDYVLLQQSWVSLLHLNSLYFVDVKSFLRNRWYLYFLLNSDGNVYWKVFLLFVFASRLFLGCEYRLLVSWFECFWMFFPGI